MPNSLRKLSRIFERVSKSFGTILRPQPGKELIAGIKDEIAGSLLSRQRNAFRKVRYEIAAVAAAVIVLAAIWTGVFEKSRSEPRRMYATIIPRAMWESDDITVDDPHLASLTADVEQIESEVLALHEDENGGNGGTAVTELEMELAVINGDLL